MVGENSPRVKRIYEPFEEADGHRVLVDRLWPRGVTRQAAHIDYWAKDLAPSAPLRRWFGHRTDRFGEFARRYTEELLANPAAQETARLISGHAAVTLLYAASDTSCNHAVVLREFLIRERPAS